MNEKTQKKEVKVEGYTIKIPTYNDMFKLNKLIMVTYPWYTLKRPHTKIPTTDELALRARQYILDNSTPKLDIHDLSINPVTKIIAKVFKF